MSDKQHVGAQSDSLTPEDVELREAIGRRTKIKPTGRAFTGVSAQGDGDWCEVEGHGRKYRLDGGQWCPHQEHDRERISDGGRKHPQAAAG